AAGTACRPWPASRSSSRARVARPVRRILVNGSCTDDRSGAGLSARRTPMDLLSSRPFWPIRDGLPAAFPPLTENSTCDVAVIGGGISGAFIAALLTGAGMDVIVLDRREVGHGSTAGN